MDRSSKSPQGAAPADRTLDLAQPGVTDLLRNQRALSVWEVLRRHRRAAARSEVAQQLGLSEPDTQKDIDLLASFGLVERVPASRHLRTGGYRVTCASLVVLIDPADAGYQPLVSSILEHVSERSIEVIRRQNRSVDTVFRRRIKRAFSWLHVNDEEFEQVRMMLRSFDALIKRIEARQIRNPSPPGERPNLHMALCVTPLDGDAPPAADTADVGHPDVFGTAANRLLAAAERSWCFGGMGTWNDIVVDDDAEQERQLALATELYEAIVDSIEQATWPAVTAPAG